MEAAKVIALGHIIAHIDYTNTLYAEVPESDIRRPQRIRNMTSKIVTGVKKYDNSTTALKTLHWLPAHHKNKIVTLVFRCNILLFMIGTGLHVPMCPDSTSTNVKTGPPF